MASHHHSHHSHHNRQRKLTPVQAILVVLLSVAILGAAYYFSLKAEDSNRNPDPVGDPDARHAYDVTIEYEGHTYRQRSNVTSILLMGIDQEESESTSVGQRGGGQADFLRLIIIDRGKKTISQLAIDRDTMAEITILGVTGNVSGTRVDNISLSHYFGDGKEKSCELTRDAVSRLLFGTRIDFYLAMNMKGIGTLNDELGGVTVTLEDDFSPFNPEWTKGTKVTLNGSEAETFVRSRRSIGDGKNTSRMRRQQQYLSAAGRILMDKIQEDYDYIGHLFDTLHPYLVSGIRRDRLVNEAYIAREYDRPEVYSISGEHKVSEKGFMQFWPDEKALKETVLYLLFQQVR